MDNRDTRRARTLALAGIAGPAAFVVAALVGAPFADGYDHVHHYVSELAAEGSNVRVLMTVGFFVLGVSLLVFAWSVRRLRPAAIALALIIALSGAGTLMAGSFSCDPGCPTTGERSTHQQLHDTSSVITFSSWIIGPFVAARQLRGDRRYAPVATALGVVALAGGLLLFSLGNREPDDPVGLMQRVVLLAVFAWLVLTSLEVRRSGSRTT